MSDGGHVWWEDAVVYEVYPRSFADADGDGVGDLPGLRSRLGYLADLGVDAIWLTPFYPSPLADGGYDVSDYCAVDPLLGTMADFDALVSGAAARQIRVIIDLVPNHCSSAHPLFRAALAAGPGSDERARFIFRDGPENEQGPGGEQPPNNWPSQFGGPAWTRVTEADGHHQGPGQWYLHLFDTSQPDWNWHHPDVPALFEGVIRFWLDRGVAGLRVDVAHGIVKDPGLPDLTGPQPLNAPSAYRHRPELQPLFRSWRAILDSYPAEGFPGPRTAVGEVWYDVPETLAPYLQSGGLPQVFNFQLILAGWRAAEFRTAIDSALAVTGGSRAPWVIGNHDVARPASRYRLDEGFTPQTVSRLIALGDRNAEAGARRARAAALVLLALPGSAYIYQGEELGLPEVTDIPDDARQDPRFFRTKGEYPGRDGCRVPLPWSAAGTGFGFSRTGQGSSPAEPWLPQPSDWGRFSVESQLADEHSTVNLYRSALRLRRDHPALGRGAPGRDALRWLGPDEGGLLCFAREPGFVLAANFGPAPVPLPAHRDVLLASGPVAGGSLPPDTAVWLGT
ncbi:MAG TPA: glycoside hydrolase family 13 protein [Streptosporangiaceae bacterium]|nr:glycoside hydrolase family 13 protein [Streptosporangiaceae bacterium]